jgi:hypothetical protein
VSNQLCWIPQIVGHRKESVDMKKVILTTIALVLALVMSLVAIPAQAATNDEILDAIDSGLEALVGMQNLGDGGWGDADWALSHRTASTCLALVKLQERAYELPGIQSPFDPAYDYSDEVIDGWEFVLQAARITKENIPVQNAGNPDVNGNGWGLDFATPVGERFGYTQGIVLMALAATGTPNRPNEGGLDFNGVGGPDTYLELAQEVAEHLAYGQVDFGGNQGGWHYVACNDPSPNPPNCSADNSVTGYSVLGLAGAEAFGVNLPAFVKPELNVWITAIQNGDGGSAYSPGGGSNILRTGNLIFEMTFIDGAAAPGTARFQNALAYIEQHWRDANKNPGWGYSLPLADYQAMYTLMKGLEYSGIHLIDTDGDTARDDDWFNQEPSASPAQDFATVLVAQQNNDGTWPGDCHTYGTQHLCQIWALLILEKITPPPPVVGGEVSVVDVTAASVADVGTESGNSALWIALGAACVLAIGGGVFVLRRQRVN